MTQRSWCFTTYQEPITTWKNIRYLIYQKEQCPSTNRIHYQGYCELNKSARLVTMKKYVGQGHYERRQGTRDQARAYCQKEDSRLEQPKEIGTWLTTNQSNTASGTRSDLIATATAIQTGATMTQLAENHPTVMMKYPRGTLLLRQIAQQKHANQRMRVDLKVTVYWGETGTGKTRKVYENQPINDLFKLDRASNNGNVWWDGYDGQRVLLIDDFYGWIKYGQLLNILDIYPLRLDVKGAFTWANWEEVYITSNKSPCNWYQGISPEFEIPAALDRRIHKILQFKNIGFGVSCIHLK